MCISHRTRKWRSASWRGVPPGSHGTPEAMLTLWIARHGETNWNHTRRYQGQRDIPPEIPQYLPVL
ncbi:MAG: histidine phosphatase family protein [Chloroflexota bacterium]